MLRLKICGITDAAFAVEAARRGVDYLGLIFAAKSPRRVTVEQAREIVAVVAGGPRFVGVFVEQNTGEILRIAKAVPLDVIQLHRAADAAEVAALKAEGFEVWQLYDLTGRSGFCAAEADAVLLDGRDGARIGGTGRRADWSLVAALQREGLRVILAGGLSAANIAAAAATGADILDVNSSLETSPGRKSIPMLDDFFRAAVGARTARPHR